MLFSCLAQRWHGVGVQNVAARLCMCKLGGVLSVCEAQVVSHELVSQSNLKAYNFCGKAQNRLANQQETRTWISFVFENSRVLLFPTFVSFHRFLIRFQFSFTHIVRQKLFLMLSFEILRGKSARGWPELISSCMPDVQTLCLSHPAPLPWNYFPKRWREEKLGTILGRS